MVNAFGYYVYVCIGQIKMNLVYGYVMVNEHVLI